MTTDDIKMIIDDLRYCPMGHPEVVRKFESLLEQVENESNRTHSTSVQIAIIKSPKIFEED